MRIHFLVNRRAGRIYHDTLTATLNREFAGHEISISTYVPGRFALEAERPDMIVSVGGDGTVNRVINATGTGGIPLGIIPRGTSNDLARALAIPRDFQHACEIIKTAHIRKIDMLSVNGVFFATCGGLGLGALVAHKVNQWRDRSDRSSRLISILGRAVYPLVLLYVLCGKWRPVRARIHDGDEVREACWATVLISNQPSFGGFKSSPAACNRDGMMDLCEIESPRLSVRLFWIALKTYLGRASTCPEVSNTRTKDVTLVTDEPASFFGDGDIIEQASSFHLEVWPEALQVAVPRTFLGRKREDARKQGACHG